MAGSSSNVAQKLLGSERGSPSAPPPPPPSSSTAAASLRARSSSSAINLGAGSNTSHPTSPGGKSSIGGKEFGEEEEKENQQPSGSTKQPSLPLRPALLRAPPPEPSRPRAQVKPSSISPPFPIFNQQPAPLPSAARPSAPAFVDNNSRAHQVDVESNEDPLPPSPALAAVRRSDGSEVDEVEDEDEANVGMMLLDGRAKEGDRDGGGRDARSTLQSLRKLNVLVHALHVAGSIFNSVVDSWAIALSTFSQSHDALILTLFVIIALISRLVKPADARSQPGKEVEGGKSREAMGREDPQARDDVVSKLEVKMKELERKLDTANSEKRDFEALHDFVLSMGAEMKTGFARLTKLIDTEQDKNQPGTSTETTSTIAASTSQPSNQAGPSSSSGLRREGSNEEEIEGEALAAREAEKGKDREKAVEQEDLNSTPSSPIIHRAPSPDPEAGALLARLAALQCSKAPSPIPQSPLDTLVDGTTKPAGPTGPSDSNETAVTGVLNQPEPSISTPPTTTPSKMPLLPSPPHADPSLPQGSRRKENNEEEGEGDSRAGKKAEKGKGREKTVEEDDLNSVPSSPVPHRALSPDPDPQDAALMARLNALNILRIPPAVPQPIVVPRPIAVVPQQLWDEMSQKIAALFGQDKGVQLLEALGGSAGDEADVMGNYQILDLNDYSNQRPPASVRLLLLNNPSTNFLTLANLLISDRSKSGESHNRCLQTFFESYQILHSGLDLDAFLERLDDIEKPKLPATWNGVWKKKLPNGETEFTNGHKELRNTRTHLVWWSSREMRLALVASVGDGREFVELANDEVVRAEYFDFFTALARIEKVLISFYSTESTK